jgi:hypothetical protein
LGRASRAAALGRLRAVRRDEDAEIEGEHEAGALAGLLVRLAEVEAEASVPPPTKSGPASSASTFAPMYQYEMAETLTDVPFGPLSPPKPMPATLPALAKAVTVRLNAYPNRASRPNAIVVGPGKNVPPSPLTPHRK